MENPTQTLRATKPSNISEMIGNLSRTLGVLGILVMLISVNIEVISRSIFGHATLWVTEVSTYLVIAVTFVGAAFAANRDANVRVDLVAGMLPPEWRVRLTKATLWISLFFALIALWKITGFWIENFRSDARSWSLLATPLWIPQFSLIVGMAAFIVAFAASSHEKSGTLATLSVIAAMMFALLQGGEIWLQGLSLHQSILVIACLTAIGVFLAEGIGVLKVMLVVVVPVILLLVLTKDSGVATKSMALIGLLFLMLFTGLPVLFCLLGIGMLAMIFWLPPSSLNFVGERAWGAVNTFEFTAIPMFVLMGAILVRSNVSAEMFNAAKLNMGKLPGSLAYASILASGVFAAISGSSLATAATMGRVAGPEMMKEHYDPKLAYGVLAAGGTLGILIPPSIAMIIYGPLAGVPVTELFLAGIIPGILMIVAFSSVVTVWIFIKGSSAPAGQNVSLKDKILALKGVAPALALMAMVLGSLYAGFATPTEAGAVGVLGALLICLVRKSLTMSDFGYALEETVLATSFLLMIAVGAAVMSFAIDFLSMPQALVDFVQGLNLTSFGLFLAIIVLYLILGMFVEPISMILMTLPVVLPVIATMGWDPLWFGIVLVMLVEIGLITPPVGMILFILAGVSDNKVSVANISAGALPFVAAYLGMLLLLFAMPDLVTLLPDTLR